MLYIVNGNDDKQARGYDIDQSSNGRKYRHRRECEEYHDEYDPGTEFNQRILPGDLALALLAASLLVGKAKQWDQFLPSQLLPTRHALRPSINAHTRIESQRDHVQKTADYGAEDE